MLDVRATAETRGDRLCERFDPLLSDRGIRLDHHSECELRGLARIFDLCEEANAQPADVWAAVRPVLLAFEERRIEGEADPYLMRVMRSL